MTLHVGFKGWGLGLIVIITIITLIIMVITIIVVIIKPVIMTIMYRARGKSLGVGLQAA